MTECGGGGLVGMELCLSCLYRTGRLPLWLYPLSYTGISEGLGLVSIPTSPGLTATSM